MRAPAGTSPVTTAPAPITTSAPSRTLGRMTASGADIAAGSRLHASEQARARHDRHENDEAAGVISLCVSH